MVEKAMQMQYVELPTCTPKTHCEQSTKANARAAVRSGVRSYFFRKPECTLLKTQECKNDYILENTVLNLEKSLYQPQWRIMCS